MLFLLSGSMASARGICNNRAKTVVRSGGTLHFSGSNGTLRNETNIEDGLITNFTSDSYFYAST